MISINDIVSMTDFQRNTKGYLRKLKGNGRPQVLTVNGKPAVIVQDAAAYQRMLDDIDFAESVAAVREGLASIERGEGKTLAQFDKVMRRKLKSLRRKHKNNRGEQP